MVTKLLLVAVLFLSTLFVQDAFGISVSGNKLMDAAGQPIILRGMNKCSFEWSPTGEMASLADYTLMAKWGSNVVRIPMNQGFWLSTSKSYNSGYKATIQQQVTWIKSLGMYIILDLHWSDQGDLNGVPGQQCMADANSVTFWSQVAAVYKNDPYVLFELYNEPHDVTWPVWLNGGSGCGFTVAGMQQMFDAIRATGANNVVIVGGLNWAFDLSGVATNPVVGSNIAYNTHPYNYAGKDSSTWDASFGYLTANYPVFATEFGQYCDTTSYVAEFLTYCKSKGLHWAAWAWYVSGCSFPSIISDWSGTPTDVAGVSVKAALGGIILPPTGAPTVGPYVAASKNQEVYTDYLTNGWSSYGWASDLTYSATAYVYDGKYSISFTPSAYAAVYVHQSTSFDERIYQSIQFYINGGSNSGQSLKVVVYDSAGNAVGNAVNLPNDVKANTWVLETIPISSFSIPAGKLISGFAIQGVTPSVPIVYVDAITLIASGSGSTSTPTTKAMTSSPTSKSGTTVPTSNPATTAPTSKPATTAPTSKSATTPPTAKAATTPPTAKSATTPPTAKAATTPPTNTGQKQATTAPTKQASSATSKPTTPASSSSGSSATVTVVLHDGSSAWWIGFNSFSGSPYTITGVLVKDSSSGAVWKSATQESWGWSLSTSGSPIVAPLSIQLVAGTRTATLNNAVTQFTGSFSTLATFA